MRIFLVATAALFLGACASDGYRYHDEGYWSATHRPSNFVVVYDSCFGSRAYGFGPSWYPWHPCSGYAYGPYFGHGGFYALYDPFWPYSHRWPGHWYENNGRFGSTNGRAGDQARGMGANMADTSERTFTRYEDLGPLRRRDLGSGGGGAAFHANSEGYAAGRSSAASGLPGNGRNSGASSRSMGLGSSRGNSNSGGGSNSGSSRSASSRARESVSGSRSEQSEE